MLWQRTLAVGPFACNCTLLADSVTKQAVVIDPGGDAPRILAALAQAALTVVGIVHTHAHCDHVGATHALMAATGAPGYLHPADNTLLTMLPLQATFLGMPAPPVPTGLRALQDGEHVQFGEHSLEVMHTPGHSPGSVCLNLVNGALCLSGDTVFAGGVGRTDLWGGDPFALRRSVRQRVLRLPDHTQLLPGHGTGCSVAESRRWLRSFLG